MLLALLTAIGWSCTDIFRKKISNYLPIEQVSWWLIVGQMPLLAVWAGYEIWTAPIQISFVYGQYVMVCGLLNALAMVMMLLAFQHSPISLTIPLLSLTPLLSAVFDFIFSNQEMTMVQWTGLMVVTVGATILGLGNNGWFKEVGAWLMVGVAINFSMLFALDRVATGLVGSGVHAFFELLVTGVWIVMYLLWRQKTDYFSAPKNSRGLIVGAVCATTLALGVQLHAYEVGIPVAMVEVVKRSVGIFASLYFGRRLFNEPLSLTKLISACVMSLGIAVMLLG